MGLPSEARDVLGADQGRPPRPEQGITQSYSRMGSAIVLASRYSCIVRGCRKERVFVQQRVPRAV